MKTETTPTLLDAARALTEYGGPLYQAVNIARVKGSNAGHKTANNVMELVESLRAAIAAEEERERTTAAVKSWEKFSDEHPAEEEKANCEGCGAPGLRDEMTYGRESHHPDAPGAYFCSRCVPVERVRGAK